MERRDLSERILAEALPIKEQLANLARLTNIAYNYRRPPKGDQLEMDFFPFSLVPLQMRQSQFEELQSCEMAIQKLFLKASEDRDFINSLLAETAKTDTFVARLLKLYNETCEHTKSDKVKCNVIRSDFMKDGPDGEWSLVEFNAISAGSATTTERLQHMNSFLSDTIMKSHYKALKQQGVVVPNKLNFNETLKVIIEAWRQYGNPKAVILMVYEGLRQNLYDEKDLENAFITAGVKTVEADFNTMHSKLRVDEQGTLFYESEEVALVHYRAGYIPDHYLHQTTWEARKTIELSRTVKLPNVGTQLINFKRAQLDLCSEKVLDKYLTKEETKLLLKHFVPMWNFEDEAEQQKLIGLCRASPKEYVLKPNLEAGGNNIYNEKILEVLQGSTPLERKKYVLMKKIRPYLNHTVMFRMKSVECSDVITEVGVFGGILSVENQIIKNVTGGCFIKSKVPTSQDGGIIAGYSVFECLMLAP